MTSAPAGRRAQAPPDPGPRLTAPARPPGAGPGAFSNVIVIMIVQRRRHDCRPAWSTAPSRGRAPIVRADAGRGPGPLLHRGPLHRLHRLHRRQPGRLAAPSPRWDRGRGRRDGGDPGRDRGRGPNSYLAGRKWGKPARKPGGRRGGRRSGLWARVNGDHIFSPICTYYATNLLSGLRGLRSVRSVRSVHRVRAGRLMRRHPRDRAARAGCRPPGRAGAGRAPPAAPRPVSDQSQQFDQSRQRAPPPPGDALTMSGHPGGPLSARRTGHTHRRAPAVLPRARASRCPCARSSSPAAQRICGSRSHAPRPLMRPPSSPTRPRRRCPRGTVGNCTGTAKNHTTTPGNCTKVGEKQQKTAEKRPGSSHFRAS